MATVRPIPAGYHSVTPHLIVGDAAGALAFYQQVFGARERMRMPAPGGKVGHAEIEIGGACILPVHIHLYVDDVDAVVARAIAAGATEVRPVKDQFYGDRTGMLEDPFGHVWHIATHVEDVPPDELERRARTAMGQDVG